MPQFRVISRQAGDRKGYHRNFSPYEHRFSRSREYIRAVRAAKLERLHAKPFVASLDGHVETVCKLEKVRNKLPIILSGDWDGEIRSWDVSQNLLNWKVHAHNGRVMGLACTNTGIRSINQENKQASNGNNLVLSTGIDKTIKIWKLNIQGTARKVEERDDATGWEGLEHESNNFNNNNTNNAFNKSDQIPISTIHHWEPFHCIDTSWQVNSTLYATGASSVKLWDLNRTHELHNFKGTVDQVCCMAFNPSQHNILACGMQDRKITFYDTRTKSPLPYVTLFNWANEISFNQIDPRLFAVANNDTCLYTFDMRNLRFALKTFRGHFDSVMSVDWNPIGNEIVSGSIDGHIRIWDASNKDSKDMNNKKIKNVVYCRELYKGKRMYNLYQVRWTYDNKYIISGSADGAIRLWKSHRSMPLHKINKRMKQSIQYSQRLKEKYGHMHEVGTIWKFRKAKIPHIRIPRNGMYYKSERFEQNKLKSLKHKIKLFGKQRSEYKAKWNKLKNKKSNSWANKVVQNVGMVHENRA